MLEGALVVFLLAPALFLGSEGWSFSLLLCHHGHKASSCLGFQGSSKDVVLYLLSVSLYTHLIIGFYLLSCGYLNGDPAMSSEKMSHAGTRLRRRLSLAFQSPLRKRERYAILGYVLVVQS